MNTPSHSATRISSLFLLLLLLLPSHSFSLPARKIARSNSFEHSREVARGATSRDRDGAATCLLWNGLGSRDVSLVIFGGQLSITAATCDGRAAGTRSPVVARPRRAAATPRVHCARAHLPRGVLLPAAAAVTAAAFPTAIHAPLRPPNVREDCPGVVGPGPRAPHTSSHRRSRHAPRD